MGLGMAGWGGLLSGAADQINLNKEQSLKAQQLALEDARQRQLQEQFDKQYALQMKQFEDQQETGRRKELLDIYKNMGADQRFTTEALSPYPNDLRKLLFMNPMQGGALKPAASPQETGVPGLDKAPATQETAPTPIPDQWMPRPTETAATRATDYRTQVNLMARQALLQQRTAYQNQTLALKAEAAKALNLYRGAELEYRLRFLNERIRESVEREADTDQQLLIAGYAAETGRMGAETNKARYGAPYTTTGWDPSGKPITTTSPGVNIPNPAPVPKLTEPRLIWAFKLPNGTIVTPKTPEEQPPPGAQYVQIPNPRYKKQ